MLAGHDISKGGNPCGAGCARVDCSTVERGSVQEQEGVQMHVAVELVSWLGGEKTQREIERRRSKAYFRYSIEAKNCKSGNL